MTRTKKTPQCCAEVATLRLNWNAYTVVLVLAVIVQFAARSNCIRANVCESNQAEHVRRSDRLFPSIESRSASSAGHFHSALRRQDNVAVAAADEIFAYICARRVASRRGHVTEWRHSVTSYGACSESTILAGRWRALTAGLNNLPARTQYGLDWL